MKYEKEGDEVIYNLLNISFNTNSNQNPIYISLLPTI